MRTVYSRRGFTFLEMALVMTIIALLIAGVVTGNDILKAARLQSVITDVNRFKNAIKLFREKYNALPGDMSNATSFWGTDGFCPTPIHNLIPKKATCDGDGDEYIAGSGSSPYLMSAVFSTKNIEAIRSWQHMGNAGFVDNMYTGTGDMGGTYFPGINIPLSKWNKAAYTLSYGGGTSAYVYTANYGHVIVFGQTEGLEVNENAFRPALKGDEALYIDQKTDDGRPGSGSVLSYKPTLASHANCTSHSDSFRATYLMSSGMATCALIFITGF